MLSEERVLEIFRETGVLLEGHFLLTSGRHSGRYLQCARVLQHPGFAAELCQELAGKFAKDKIDLCVGPALGGVIVAYETARALGVRGFFTERDKGGTMALRRGFMVSPGERALVLEDVVTTGGSVKEVIELLTGRGAVVAGVGSIVDRSGGRVDFGVPFYSLLKIEVESYGPEDCPLCRQGLAAVKPGSRR